MSTVLLYTLTASQQSGYSINQPINQVVSQAVKRHPLASGYEWLQYETCIVHQLPKLMEILSFSSSLGKARMGTANHCVVSILLSKSYRFLFYIITQHCPTQSILEHSSILFRLHLHPLTNYFLQVGWERRNPEWLKKLASLGIWLVGRSKRHKAFCLGKWLCYPHTPITRNNKMEEEEDIVALLSNCQDRWNQRSYLQQRAYISLFHNVYCLNYQLGFSTCPPS